MKFFFRGLSTQVKNTGITFTSFYGVILIYVFAKVEYHYFLQIQDGGHPWQTGDWLINYQSGFVRRGLVGELIFTLSSLTHLDILWLTFCMQTLIFFTLLYYQYRIVRIVFRTSQSIDFRRMTMLLLSPAGVLFCIYNLDFSLRKEVIGLALIHWMYFYRLRTDTISSRYVLISLCIYVFFIFSWEAGIAFLPFILSLLLDKGQVGRSFRFSDFRKFRIIFALVISFLCFIVSIVFHGTSSQSVGICESILPLGNIDQNLCTGAVDAVGWTFSYFWSGSTVGSPLRLLGFSLLFLISCLPLLQLSYVSRHKWLLIQFGVSFFFFNVLAADTGRLIYVFSLIFTNQFLYHLWSYKSEERLQEEKLQDNRFKNTLKLLLPIIYITVWTVPASGNPWLFLRF